MPRARISIADKQRLVDAHERGEDYLDLARQLGIHRGTAWAIVRRAADRDGVVALPRGGRRRAFIDNEIRDELVTIVEQHPTYTLLQLNAELRLRLPEKPHISTTSVARCLSNSLIVVKKMEDSPRERNSEVTKLARRDYAAWLMQIQVVAELVFIDEAGINLWLRRTRGRAPRGQRAVRVVNGRRGRNLTVIFAVSSQRGLLAHDIFEGGMTGDRFVQFLETVSDANAQQQMVMIFDNAPAHLRALGNQGPQFADRPHQVRRLPPYSPFLNLVEQAISAYKAMLKRDLEEIRPQLLDEEHDQRMAHLAQLSEQSIVAITPQHARHWYGLTQRNIPACLQMQDIIM